MISRRKLSRRLHVHAFVGVVSTYRHTHSSKRGAEFTDKIMNEQSYAVETVVRGYHVYEAA